MNVNVKKFLASLLAGVVSVAAGIGVAVVGQYFDLNSNVKVESPSEFNNNDNIVITPGASNEIKLLKAPLYASDGSVEPRVTGHTITATVTTANSSLDDDLTWELKWTSSDSWSSGKTVTDYVAMSVASDTHSATVTCKKAFGTPITVSVKSKSYASTPVTCQLDYVKRINGGTITRSNFTETLGAGSFDFVATYTFGTGTLTPSEVWVENCVLRTDGNEYWNVVRSHQELDDTFVDRDQPFGSYEYKCTISGNTVTFSDHATFNYQAHVGHSDEVYNTVLSYLAQEGTDLCLTMIGTFVVKYNGVAYDGGWSIGDVDECYFTAFDASAATQFVQVSLSESSLIL